MTTYRVEIDGQTVWTGEGESWLAIPDEHRARPESSLEGDPHPHTHDLYETTEDGDEQLFARQHSLAHEYELVIAAGEGEPPGSLKAVAAIRARSDLSALRAAQKEA